MKEVFPMTIKGICLTCLGDVFADDAELDRLSAAYHKCWREMEVEWRQFGRSVPNFVFAESPHIG